jgi:lauroyl/myristoyl acyltransferase
MSQHALGPSSFREAQLEPLPSPSAAPLALPRPAAPASRFAIDGLFWRRLAEFGATHTPGWFVRIAPSFFGVAVAILMPSARHRIRAQLDRVRGEVGFFRRLADIARTFATYAQCLTELLTTGSKNARTPNVLVHPNAVVDAILAARGGAIFATAHTAGWESMGPLLAREQHRRVMVVMQPERDARAREIVDSRRAAERGVSIVHVGGDPFASLPLLRHLREGGIVALQMDRVPDGMTSRSVELFGGPGAIPEGPLRLAQLTGVPIIPVFSSRTGHRRYEVHMGKPVTVPRRAPRVEIDAAAQALADELTAFVSAHPTQWFPFHG